MLLLAAGCTRLWRGKCRRKAFRRWKPIRGRIEVVPVCRRAHARRGRIQHMDVGERCTDTRWTCCDACMAAADEQLAVAEVVCASRTASAPQHQGEGLGGPSEHFPVAFPRRSLPPYPPHENACDRMATALGPGDLIFSAKTRCCFYLLNGWRYGLRRAGIELSAQNNGIPHAGVRLRGSVEQTSFSWHPVVLWSVFGLFARYAWLEPQPLLLSLSQHDRTSV
jgi:hypothetical protein